MRVKITCSSVKQLTWLDVQFRQKHSKTLQGAVAFHNYQGWYLEPFSMGISDNRRKDGATAPRKYLMRPWLLSNTRLACGVVQLIDFVSQRRLHHFIFCNSCVQLIYLAHIQLEKCQSDEMTAVADPALANGGRGQRSGAAQKFFWEGAMPHFRKMFWFWISLSNASHSERHFAVATYCTSKNTILTANGGPGPLDPPADDSWSSINRRSLISEFTLMRTWQCAPMCSGLFPVASPPYVSCAPSDTRCRYLCFSYWSSHLS